MKKGFIWGVICTILGIKISNMIYDSGYKKGTQDKTKETVTDADDKSVDNKGEES